MEGRMNVIRVLFLFSLAEVLGNKRFDRQEFLRDIRTNRTQNEQTDTSTFSTGSASTCKEVSFNCANYKEFCRSNKIVEYYCQDTCGLCFWKTAPKVEENCRDQNTQCGFLAVSKYCVGSVSQRRFMKQRCRKTCKICVKAVKKVQITWPTLENCGRVPEYLINPRTIEGSFVKKGDYPWQAAVIFQNSFLCGASLIDPQFILSAAHCYEGIESELSNFTVVLGDHNRYYPDGTEQTFGVVNITIHSAYVGEQRNDDIALIKLSEPATYTNFIRPICLPEAEKEVAPGASCHITGWGSMFNAGKPVNILQEIAAPVIKNDACAQRNNNGSRVVTNKMVCTGFKDGDKLESICHGDNGGPMQCADRDTWTLHGVVSWGSPTCNGNDAYNVFTRVSEYRKWINDTYYDINGVVTI